jgi:hypothetical protein
MVVSCDPGTGGFRDSVSWDRLDLGEGCCAISVCVIRVNSPIDVRLEV